MSGKKFILMNCCAWTLILLCTGLLYFKITLTTDTLFYQDLFSDLFQYGGHWSDWRFSTAPDYFPDLFLYFIAYWLFKTPTACLFFVTMIQAVLVGLSSLWLAQKIRPTLSDNAKIAVLLSVAFTSLVAANSHMELYWNYSNVHVSSFLFSLIALGALITYLETAKKVALMLMTFSCIIGILDDAIFIISFYATAFVLLSSLYIGSRFSMMLLPYKKKFLWSILALLSAYPVEYMVNALITYNDPLAGRIPLTISGISIALHIFINSIFNLFFPFEFWIFLFTSLIILGMIHFVFLFFRQVKFTPNSISKRAQVIFLPITDFKFAFVGSFLALLIPISVSAIILSGGIEDIWCYRYLMFPIALLILMTIIDLDRRQFFAAKYILGGAILFLLSGAGTTLLRDLQLLPNWFQQTTTPWHVDEGLESERDAPQLLTCLKQIEQSGVTLTSGLSLINFYGRGIAMRLPDKTYIMYTNFFPSDLLSNIGIYLRPKHYRINYNFVIVPRYDFVPHINIWQDIPISTTIYTIAEMFYPKGYKRFSCNKSFSEIWVYPDTTLNDFIQPKIQQFLFLKGKIKQATWFGADLLADTGKKQGVTRIAQAPADKPGYLVYSLSISSKTTILKSVTLKPGKYRVTIYYSAKNKLDGDIIGRWYIGKTFYPFSLIKNDQIIYDGLLAPAKNGTVSAEFTIPEWGSKANQVLVWYSGHGQLIVNKMVFERKRVL